MGDRDALAVLTAAGIPKGKAEGVLKDVSLSSRLLSLIQDHEIFDASKNAKQGNLLILIAENASKLDKDGIRLVVDRVKDGRISSNDQLNAAISYLEANESYDEAELDKAAGIGGRRTALIGLIADLDK